MVSNFLLKTDQDRTIFEHMKAEVSQWKVSLERDWAV